MRKPSIAQRPCLQSYLVSAAISLVACGKSEAPPPPSDAAAPARTSSGLTLDIRREPDLFEARGKVPGGSIPAALEARLASFSRRVVAFEELEGASPSTQDAVAPLFELALVLHSGRVEVTPKTVRVEGKTRTEADRLQAQQLVRVAAGLLALEAKDELAVDPTVFAPSEGFVRYTDDSAVTALLLYVDDVSPPIEPDDVGRVPEGIYRIGKTSQHLAVAAGRTTWLRPGQPEGGILMGGKRFPLDTDLRVVAPGDPGALDVASARGRPTGCRYSDLASRHPASESRSRRSSRTGTACTRWSCTSTSRSMPLQASRGS